MASASTLATPSPPSAPLSSTLAASSPAAPSTALPEPHHTSEARTAFLASLSSVGTTALHPLELRAADIAAASKSITGQQIEVERQTQQLARQTAEYQKLANDGAKGLKEIGDVGNWAEMLERDLAVLEETMRIVEEGEETGLDDEAGGEGEERENVGGEGRKAKRKDKAKGKRRRARLIVELKARDKSKIESLLSYGDRLLVGLNTGSLRIYRINESIGDAGSAAKEERPQPQSSPQAAELLRELERFSRHKIEQLAIIKEANSLVSLSNGTVSIHDLSSYELQESLTKTKGASAFAVTSNIVKDETTGIPSIVSRLAVAVKRRLLLWSWHDSELSAETLELNLTTGIKTLTWVTATRLIAGLSSSYVLVDVATSTVTDIVGPGSIGGGPGQDVGRFGGVGVASIGYMGIGGAVPKPLVTRLCDGQVLLAKDINTHFIDTNGEPLGRRQIPWSTAPEAIGYSYPFLLALQTSKGALEVRNPETLTALQSISLPNATLLHVPSPYVSLAHAGKGFLVCSERCIWRMDALGYDAQISSLSERKQYDEAISLLEMLEDALLQDKNGRLRELKMLKAEDMFARKRYRESLDLFTEVSAPPQRVIRLYPETISGEMRNHAERIDEVVRAHMVSDDANGSMATDTDVSEAAESTGSASEAFNKISQSIKSAYTTRPALSIEGSINESVEPGGCNASGAHDWKGKDLEVASIELAGFLVGVRTKLQRMMNPDGTLKQDTEDAAQSSLDTDELMLPPVTGDGRSAEHILQDTAKLVDTTLFRAHMLARPSLVGSLFRLPNFCDVNVVKEKLLETSRYNELIDFLFGKKLHHEALELLKRFGQAENTEDTPEQFRGPRRTVAYLQNLTPEMIDLIFQYAEWPLHTNPDLGMEIFMADTENAETLPRHKVLDFLQTINPSLATKYLEHIILELKDDNPDLHQRLLELYLRSLKSAEEAEKPRMREKLLQFLKTSLHYESWRVLRLLSKDDHDLLEARAIVLGRIGEHRQALNIYVFDIKDPTKAEEYVGDACAIDAIANKVPTSPEQIHNQRLVSDAEDDTPSVYHILLSLYLSPSPPREPQWVPALNLLAKHGSRLPASSTLGLVPQVIPVSRLESYFRARIRAANTVVCEARVAAGLRQVMDREQERRLRLGDEVTGDAGRNRSVVVTEERLCGACHKRFGGSAIKVLPE